MKSNTFVTRLTRGAVASGLAVGWAMPEKHSAMVAPPMVARASVVTDQASMPEESSHPNNEGRFVLNLVQDAKEWTARMEREFRQLALAEAKRTLPAQESARLDHLSLWRERLQNPRPAEEVLLQLKRDRVLEKMSEVLRQYVELEEGAGTKRSAAA